MIRRTFTIHVAVTPLYSNVYFPNTPAIPHKNPPVMVSAVPLTVSFRSNRSVRFSCAVLFFVVCGSPLSFSPAFLSFVWFVCSIAYYDIKIVHPIEAVILCEIDITVLSFEIVNFLIPSAQSSTSRIALVMISPSPSSLRLARLFNTRLL